MFGVDGVFLGTGSAFTCYRSQDPCDTNVSELKGGVSRRNFASIQRQLYFENMSVLCFLLSSL